ncbi:hypothetical protein Goshw_006466, partial [Gossypium schwendimanii]|nr:hypothetical protein [Gossypium schwendimanii]
YLEEKYPQHPLFPFDLVKKALNVQEYIEEKVSPDEKIPWTKVHIEKGFEVRLPAVSVKTTVAVRLDTVTILWCVTKSKLKALHRTQSPIQTHP